MIDNYIKELKWNDPKKFTPENNQRIFVLWNRNENYCEQINLRIYKEKLKYPYGIHREKERILGWLPIPKKENILDRSIIKRIK